MRLAPAPAVPRDRCNRCCRSNSLVQQIIRAAPYPRIVVSLRPQQPNDRSHALATSKRLRRAPASAPAGHRTVSRTPPSVAACASLASFTTSTVATRTSIRCDGSVAEASSTFCSSSVRIGPASTTVPSTERNNPSESLTSSGAGAGCGSISPHHAPSSIHRTASGKPHNPLRPKPPRRTAPQPAPTESAPVGAQATPGSQPQSPRQTATPHEITARRSSHASVARGWVDRRASGPDLKIEFGVKPIRNRKSRQCFPAHRPLPPQPDHRLQVKRLRKQISERQALDGIARADQHAQIARQRGRIA